MLTSLNISNARSQIAQRMISTLDSIPGFEIVALLGTVESVIERKYKKTSVGAASNGLGLGVELAEGGGLSDLIFEAKQELAASAHEVGADAVVGFRFSLAGRDLEKSLIAYGTAVKARKIENRS